MSLRDERKTAEKFLSMVRNYGKMQTTAVRIAADMKKLFLPMLFLLLCACSPSSKKPAASVTGSDEPDAVKEDQRHAVDGLGPR
jgi:hypothetical protein